jgi:hypothetical protein
MNGSKTENQFVTDTGRSQRFFDAPYKMQGFSPALKLFAKNR